MADPGTAEPGHTINMDALRRSWKSVWSATGVEPSDPALFAKLIRAYSEPHRKYHTLQHLVECLGLLEEVWPLAERPGEIGIALWFHDAIYDLRAADNEEKSAEWARRALIEAGGPVESADRVCELVLATRHTAPPSWPDEQLLADIDLSILGAPRARFEEYEKQVREEYARVPFPIYRKKRRGVLQSLMSRPFIYSTAHFRACLEEPARENLRRSMARLGGMNDAKQAPV